MPNRNGIIHEGIIDDLRFNLSFLFHKEDDFPLVIADEGMMAHFCNGGDKNLTKKGMRERPDLVIRYKNQFAIIEVGTLHKDKWLDFEWPVIHVSHNKAVGLISGDYNEILAEILQMCRSILKVY